MLTKEQLIKSLDDAAHAHHEYETKDLKGKRDENWAEWYADKVLKQVGNFTTLSALTDCLAQTTGDKWSEAAAKNVMQKLGPGSATAQVANIFQELANRMAPHVVTATIERGGVQGIMTTSNLKIDLNEANSEPYYTALHKQLSEMGAAVVAGSFGRTDNGNASRLVISTNAKDGALLTAFAKALDGAQRQAGATPQAVAATKNTYRPG